jgi:hypothetical protein
MARLLLALAVFIFAARALLRLVRLLLRRTAAGGAAGGASTASAATDAGPPAVSEMVRDPVCGRFVAVGTAVAVREDGVLRHYCSDDCRRQHLAAARA